MFQWLSNKINNYKRLKNIKNAPVDLPSCHEKLDKKLCTDLRNKITAGAISTGQLHMSVGMYIRNNWGLWYAERTKLKDWFTSIGIHHTDDMSGIILDSYVAYLRDEPYDLMADVKKYKDHWVKHNSK